MSLELESQKEVVMENKYNVRFYGTGNDLDLELSVHFRFSLNSAFSLYEILRLFHNKKSCFFFKKSPVIAHLFL